MKIGIQVLKKHYPPQSAFGRTRSVDKSPQDLSKETPCPQNELFLYKELSCIEHKLDRSEISSTNTPFHSLGTIDKEMRNYLDYLNEITALIKKKDSRLSHSLIRGIIGIGKTFEKLLQRAVKDSGIISSYAKPQGLDFSCQTIEEKPENTAKFEFLPELETIKQLTVALKKIRIPRVTGQLLDLYETLTNMQTEVPEATTLPDFQYTETPDSIMNMHLNVLKTHIFQTNTESKLEAPRHAQEKLTQTDKLLAVTPEVKILEKTVYEKEQEIKKIKEKAESSSAEKKFLEEKIRRIQNIYSQIEKKQGESEIETMKIKNKYQHSEIVIIAQEKRIKWFDGKLLKKTEKLIKAKLRINELKSIIVKKQQVLAKMQDELYDTKINWKVCEEKLFDIQRAWEKKTGREFQFKEVDIQLVISKNGIVKEEILDELEDDIESSVSDNEPPDAEEFLEIIKAREQDIAEVDQSFLDKLNYSEKISSFSKKKQLIKEISQNYQETNKEDSSQEELTPKNSKKIIEKIREKKEKKIREKIREKRNEKINSNGKSSGESSGDSSGDSVSDQSDFKETPIDLEKKHKIKPKKLKKQKDEQNEISQISASLEFPVPKHPEKALESFKRNLEKPFESSPKPKLLKKSPFSTETKVTEKTSSSVVSQKKAEFFSYESSEVTYPSTVQELIKLEKKLTIEFGHKEQEFVKSFIDPQPRLFKDYKRIKEELETIRKELNIQIMSTSVQCNLIEARALINRRTKSVVNEGNNPFDEVQDEDERELIENVFEDDKVLMSIGLRDKIQIVKAVKGHKKNICKEMCPHLLRVLKIKWKVKGSLYPVRKILIRSVDFD